MAEARKDSGGKRFKNKEAGFCFADVEDKAGFCFADVKDKVGFCFADVKIEPGLAEMETEVDTKIEEKIEANSFKIKTEPNLTTDCDTASAPVNSMHQESNSLDIEISAIKKEFDIDTNNVTVELIISDSLLANETNVDIQPYSRENELEYNNSADSDVPLAQSMLTETREDNSRSSIVCDAISENTSTQVTPLELKERRNKKLKYATDFLTLKSSTPQSSTAASSEIVLEKSNLTKKGKKSSKKRKSNEISAVEINSDDDDLESYEPPTTMTSNEISKKCLNKQKGEKLEKKSSTSNKEKVVCPFCDRTISKAYFPYHVRVHTDEKPFKCSQCSYSSHFKNPLEFHMQSHHPTEGYVNPNLHR